MPRNPSIGPTDAVPPNDDLPNPAIGDPLITIPTSQMDRILKRLDELEWAHNAAQRTDPNGRTQELLAQALTRLSETTLASAQIQAEATNRVAAETKRAHRPSNEVTPMISVFNRRGNLLEEYQKPKLRCTMLVPWLLENDSCTREEVELFNLLEPGEYRIRRIDRSFITVTVSVEYKADQETLSRLVLTHETGYNNDNFRLMPANPDWLRYVLKQHKNDLTRALADCVLSDEQEEALISTKELSVSH